MHKEFNAKFYKFLKIVKTWYICYSWSFVNNSILVLQLAKVYQACNSNNVKRAMFSATFAVEVEEWCKLNLDNVLQVYIGAK